MSVSLSVSFYMFPCSKGHFIRAYLDTIKMTLDIFFPFNTSPILRSSWFPSRSDIPTFYTTQTIWKEEKFDPSELQFRGGATMHCILFFFLRWMNFKDFLKRPIRYQKYRKKKLLYNIWNYLYYLAYYFDSINNNYYDWWAFSLNTRLDI